MNSMHTAEVPNPVAPPSGPESPGVILIGTSVEGKDRPTLPRVVTTVEALLPAFDQGMKILPGEDGPAAVWTGQRLTFHRSEAVLPETNAELDLAHSIAKQTRSLVDTAREAVVQQKLAGYWKDYGNLTRAAAAKVKETAARAKLKLTEFEIAQAELRVHPWNLVPYGLTAEFKEEIELRRSQGQPVTRQWYQATRDRLLNEYSPKPKPVKTTDRPAAVDQGSRRRVGVMPIGPGSAGLPEIPPATPATTSIQVDKRVATAFKVGLGFTALAELMSLPGCTAATPVPLPPASAESPAPQISPTAETTPTPRVETTPTTFVQQGPEATPSPASVYPASLSFEQINGSLGGGGELPAGFMDHSEVKRIYELRKAWLRQSGFNVDNPAQDNYVSVDIVTWGERDTFRWEVVGKDRAGDLVGWLQIADPNIQTGWRYADRPSWDSRFDPGRDAYRFGLPEKLDSQNKFVIASLVSGGQDARVLVEVDKDGQPIRWLSVAIQEMQAVVGVPAIPTKEPTATLEPLPVISDSLTGAQVTARYDFNSNRLDGWSYSSTTVRTMADGTVQLNGEGSWGSASLNLEKALEPGTAVVVDIRATNGPMELYMDTGTFGDADYRRVGVHIQQDRSVTANIFEGSAFLQPALSGTLKTLHPEKWYRALFAVASDGTVRLVMWDRDDPTKQLQYNAAYPELAGKSMKFAAGVHTGVLNIDEAEVLAFTALSVLPEVPVQATLIPAQPTPEGQEPPPVVNPPIEQPPAQYNLVLVDNGTMYKCPKCAWDTSFLSGEKVTQIILSAGDLATQSITYSAELSVEQFNIEMERLKKEGYQPYNMTWFQPVSFGDPNTLRANPISVWYYMQR